MFTLLDEFNIPMAIHPLYWQKKENITKQKCLIQEFIKATKKKVFIYKNNLTESVEILNRYVTEYNDFKKWFRKINFLNTSFCDESNCGVMKQERVLF
jgi:hypothetical protein